MASRPKGRSPPRSFLSLTSLQIASWKAPNSILEDPGLDFRGSGVNFSRFSDLTLKLLKRASDEVLLDYASKDNFSKELHNEILKFRKEAMFWSNYSEKDYLAARNM